MSLKDITTIGAFVVKRIDQVSAWLKRRGRVNEINKIERDAAGRDDESDNKRLRDSFKKYDDDVKSAS